MSYEDCTAELIDRLMSSAVSLPDEMRIEFRAKLHIILHDYAVTRQTGEMVVYDGDTNTNILKRFILSKAVAGCSQRTLRYYQKTIQIILAKIGKNVQDIDSNDIEFWMARRIMEVSKVTVNNERRALSSLFAWLVANEIIMKNPILKTEKVKELKVKKEAFSDIDLAKIRAACVSLRENALIEVLISTGCRVSEVAGIKIGDIDGNKVMVLGKGGKYRTVYLNAAAQVAIQRYLAERKDTNPYLFCGGEFGAEKYSKLRKHDKMRTWYSDPEYVHPDKPIDKSSIEQQCRKIGKRAGVDKCHPHRFRRTCATDALKSGMPIEMVSKMLGHESIATTQIYLDINEDDLEMAHRKYVR